MSQSETDREIEEYNELNSPIVWFLCNERTAPSQFPCWTMGSCSSEVLLAFVEAELLDYWLPLISPEPGHVSADTYQGEQWKRAKSARPPGDGVELERQTTRGEAVVEVSEKVSKALKRFGFDLEALERLGFDLGLSRRGGEKPDAYRRRLTSRIRDCPPAGSAMALEAAAKDVLPASVSVTLDDGVSGVVLILHEPWWRRLLVFPARRDRRRVMVAEWPVCAVREESNREV